MDRFNNKKADVGFQFVVLLAKGMSFLNFDDHFINNPFLMTVTDDTLYNHGYGKYAAENFPQSRGRYPDIENGVSIQKGGLIIE